ncbi:NAD(P)/FAD-dependent oxidoreductase [Rhizobium leguminosarum]|uniref:NAD(P)/FAD-dependent oxidoreductase n=1 Tax=Rhizobium leguminosarum TaxID=384 RepID=UPI00103038C8|nr:NAD(P)/FAD-dependent oxidoreductase [Rhizobium leguminosarum]QIO76240.1 NAD(P)/FAD-dependent oxidoreductase [Rhizobium leguminosarum bv. trifolii]QIO83258.1 NAD(P)/FAD-dependent oxidoreductase [Rhizobium leguminosarum bv. trifolii]TAU16489.1 NAD(P)/FAD-dependent oxidoreductase [Rhizobium leguminosarum]TAU34816.1 NAD(P)/FAD-dependent oxidoreductase [Rhizobium leguminosarum]TAX44006.1 NAD(P)/FAD-dependent oxidoreductase [Rhizobium leguminosarum]
MVNRPPASPRPRVAVVGAGFAGLAVAQGLRSAPVDITLLDRRNFHLFQPLLYQVATASLSPGQISWPVRSVFSAQKNARVLMMEVNAVDTRSRTVTDGSSVVPYDYLVLATGARHAYFGNERWEPFAPGLKTIEDARALRENLLRAYETAEKTRDGAERRRCLTTVIVGGGATGVEMAGAVAELANRTLKGEFRTIDPQSMRIVVVEAGPRLLRTFPVELSEKCLSSLDKMNVEVRLKSRVTDCDAKGVSVDGLRIDAATVIWAAGVQASPAANWLNARADKSNRVFVSAALNLDDHPEIFVIGDTCAAMSDGKPVPGIAPAAKQMGAYVAKVIGAHAAQKPPPPPFRYRHQGDLAVVGRSAAVVRIGKISLTGFTGWIFWSLVHVMFLIGFRSKTSVALDWIWAFVTRQRSARLISDGDASPLATSASSDVQLSPKRDSTSQGGGHAA